MDDKHSCGSRDISQKAVVALPQVRVHGCLTRKVAVEMESSVGFRITETLTIAKVKGLQSL
jgi:hypothetical protein